MALTSKRPIAGLFPRRSTPIFTDLTLPAGLRRNHQVKKNV